jgi:hypothetical protein
LTPQRPKSAKKGKHKKPAKNSSCDNDWKPNQKDVEQPTTKPNINPNMRPAVNLTLNKPVVPMPTGNAPTPSVPTPLPTGTTSTFFADNRHYNNSDNLSQLSSSKQGDNDRTASTK